MSWWSKLPSLTPVKGLAKFLYIWSHWDEISADLKKRDERLQAVEELARQMVRLKEEAHEEEKRALARKMKEELDKWRALTDRGGEIIDMAVARMEELQKEAEGLRGTVADVMWRLAVMLYFADSQVRDALLSNTEPQLRETLNKALQLTAKRAVEVLRSESTGPLA